MQLEKIITLANQNTRLRFLAMERSLRSTGCQLPLWVIPYDDKKFELPENAKWWELKNVLEWLVEHKAHKVMRKYQCLQESNYQFVDADVIFLENPEAALQDFFGFVTSCGHWHNPGHTTTPELLNFFDQKTTVWQQKIFNSGQFACERQLYDFEEFKKTASYPAYKATCIDFKFHEQPGMNLLVNLSGIPITNVTLQPFCMESTWAGDYHDENYERFWKGNRRPYLIHWAGCKMNINRPIDKLFLNFLTEKEKSEWAAKIAVQETAKRRVNYKIRQRLRKAKAAIKLLSE